MNPGESSQIKLLVVEDNPHVVQQYKIGFKETAFESILVSDGEEALVVYRQWQPDIVLLDIMLPGMSGYSILKKIRSDLRDRKTAIIMATGLSRREDIMDCARLGISGYIVKPFNPKEIGGLIMTYFQKDHA